MKPETTHPEVLEKIMSVDLPKVINPNMRSKDRREWAAAVRTLFKKLGITHISVTTPSYSMAQGIHVNTPDFYPWEGIHEQRHAEIDEADRVPGTPWMGYGTHCEYCKQTSAAKHKLESIILAAYPDLNDRSKLESDHFNYCFSVR